ncbi:MAG: hypothetical protein JNK75_11960 [Betaproteobacteria bacterium]|nr:hypothetical protein [Betaproteobacteria bacterium]
MEKVVTKARQKDASGDLAYWLSQPPVTRVEAVEVLRRQAHGQLTDAQQRLQRVAQVTQRQQR